MEKEYQALSPRQKIIYWSQKAGMYYSWFYTKVKHMYILDQVESAQYPITVRDISRAAKADPAYFTKPLKELRGGRVTADTMISRREALAVLQKKEWTSWSNPGYFPELQPYIDRVVAASRVRGLQDAAERSKAEEAALAEMKAYFSELSLEALGKLYQSGKNEELSELENQVIRLVINGRLNQGK